MTDRVLDHDETARAWASTLLTAVCGEEEVDDAVRLRLIDLVGGDARVAAKKYQDTWARQWELRSDETADLTALRTMSDRVLTDKLVRWQTSHTCPTTLAGVLHD